LQLLYAVGIGPFDFDVEDECYDHMRLGYPVPNCKCTFCVLKAEKSQPTTKPKKEKDPCARQPELQTLYIEQPIYREPAYEKERLFKEKNIQGYEPFGAIFQKDEHYKDFGLQPPDPFKEHPVDRDNMADSPQESHPDDPNEEPCSPVDETPIEEAADEAAGAEAGEEAAAEETPEEAEPPAEEPEPAAEENPEEAAGEEPPPEDAEPEAEEAAE